jgi:hypothetical protein
VRCAAIQPVHQRVREGPKSWSELTLDLDCPVRCVEDRVDFAVNSKLEFGVKCVELSQVRLIVEPKTGTTVRTATRLPGRDEIAVLVSRAGADYPRRLP